MKQTDRLLEAREAQGLQATIAARLIMLFVFMPLDLVAAPATALIWPWFGVLAALLGINLLFLQQLRWRRHVGLIGLIGAALDIAVYFGGVGALLQFSHGDGLPPSVLINTGMPMSSIVMILINGLAVRPRYPLIVTGGMIAAMLWLLAMALSDDRVTLTERFVQYSARPDQICPGLFIGQVGLVAGSGVIVTFIAWIVRRTIRGAVRLEKLNTAMAAAQTEVVVEEKIAALEGLVAGISHEMNTPVGVVASTMDTTTRSVDRIREVLARAEDLTAIRGSKRLSRALEALERNADLAREAGARIDHTINTLKKFVRLDESALKPIDINQGIEDTIKLLRHQLEARVTIETRLGELPPLFGYPGRINQVFFTIMRNAAESIKGSGTIIVTTSVTGASVRVEISDTGRGIAPGDLPGLFELGFATETVQQRRVHARMGLPICRSIVRRHGGTICVESTPGRGTTFRIDLPVDSGIQSARTSTDAGAGEQS